MSCLLQAVISQSLLHSEVQDLSEDSNLIPKPFSPYIAAPAILGLVYRAYSRKSLTPFGIVVAALTAVVHAIHPWSIFFALLVVFFLAGTAVTRVLGFPI